jgi:ribosomal protein S27AE
MTTKMICPHCGSEMNLHAEKLVYTGAIPNAQADAENTAGGHVEEMHTCPRCGLTESRIAA